jgi:hypothetical protein
MLLALGEAYCLCPPRLRKSLRHKALTMASALANAVKVRREREEAG